jgi:hypothetical protein
MAVNVRIEQLRCHNCNARIFVQNFHERANRTWSHFGVWIEKQDLLTASDCKNLIVSRRETTIVFVRNQTHPRVIARHHVG